MGVFSVGSDQRRSIFDVNGLIVERTKIKLAAECAL